MIALVARQQLTTLHRQRTAVTVVGLFVAMTALAGVIGWSSTQTISRVYDQAVVLLAQTGTPAPANPIGIKPTLSLLSNMTVYLPLVGALLAVLLGHLVIADDRTSGVGRLLFSRRLSGPAYLAGKAAAVGAVLAVALTASLLVSVLALLIANGNLPTAADLGRLALFYALSLLYLSVFALVGMAAVLLTRKRSLALLSAMGVWLVVTFAVPQFTSGLRPTASLNPVSDPASATTAFFRATAHARPLSLSEQYKAASADLLQTGPAHAVTATLGHAVPLLLGAGLLALLVSLTVRRHDWSRSMAGE
ncbi:MAG: ABC transporter permease [Frankiales bacterium]|nr:MAG: ABC transporter permease [Frankiales bacterium]